MENKIHVPNHQPGNFPIVHSHLQGLVQEIMALVKVLAALNSPDRPGCDRMGIMEDNGHVFFFCAMVKLHVGYGHPGICTSGKNTHHSLWV